MGLFDGLIDSEIDTKKAPVKSKCNNIREIIKRAESIIDTVPMRVKNQLELVTDADRFTEYIDKSIENGVMGYDTETTGLNPISDDLAGLCLYTPDEKGIYVPINHINYITNERFKGQIEKRLIVEQIQRIKESKTKLIMHNGKFDVRFTRHQLGVDLASSLYWDTQVAAYLLNETESHKLKTLWNKYPAVIKDELDLDFRSLFGDISFALVPLQTAYVYAARDPLLTYELYKFQEPFLDSENKVCKQRGLEKMAKLFRGIDMPLVHVIADMEDEGVNVDLDYGKELSKKYHDIQEKQEELFKKECEKNKAIIEDYRKKARNNKLSEPININSPSQIAILLYDIFKCPSVNKKAPRTTDSDALELINNPFAKLVLDYRKTEKLLSTYIDAIPNHINKITNKIHASVNQTFTDTGRLSYNTPNLQNLPRENKEVRKIFVPKEGNCFVSADYSQEEVKILAFISQDEALMAAAGTGKDVYANIGSFSFQVAYEDCLEKFIDGTYNKEGKLRRDSIKGVVLGIMYGRAAKSIADGLKVTLDKAQQIINLFHKTFPKVNVWVNNTVKKAKQTGYVETLWGRRRRLPDMQLPEFEFEAIDGFSTDPLSFEDVTRELTYGIVNKYNNLLNKSRSNFRKIEIKEQAKKDGISIKDNSFKIASATRQAMNSPIQGSAGDLIRLTMVKLTQYQRGILEPIDDFELDLWLLSKRFYELGARLLIQVHDELICECSITNSKEVGDILQKIMMKAPSKTVTIPMKVDVDITDRWYGFSVLESEIGDEEN